MIITVPHSDQESCLLRFMSMVKEKPGSNFGYACINFLISFRHSLYIVHKSDVVNENYLDVKLGNIISDYNLILEFLQQENTTELKSYNIPSLVDTWRDEADKIGIKMVSMY